MIEFVIKTRDYVIINKPVGVPSQPDPSGDDDAMSLTAAILRESGEDDKLWLVHRLDRTVGGLLVLARCERAAAELSRLASSGELQKHYLAVAEKELQGGILTDFIYKDAMAHRAYVVKSERRGVKRAELRLLPLAGEGGKFLYRVILHTGRFHQIRVQLASRGAPLVGDGKYGSRDKGARHPALFAYRLSFAYGGDTVTATALPDISSYPWSIFKDYITEIKND